MGRPFGRPIARVNLRSVMCFEVVYMTVPREIGRAKVIYYTTIDDRHIVTGNTRHYHNNRLLDKSKWLAICKYDKDEGYYIFQGHGENDDLSDTYHETLDDAIQQAEYEFIGISKTFKEPTNV